MVFSKLGQYLTVTKVLLELSNIQASILTTALLKSMGIPFILARAVSEIHLKVLKQVGADEVVNLEIEEGRVVATRLLTQEALERISISADYSIAEVYAPPEVVGNTVGEMKDKSGVNIMAVKRITTTIDNLGNPVRDEVVRLPSEQDIVRENASRLSSWTDLQKPIIKNNFNLYRKELSEAEIRFVEALCSEEMDYFGYEREFDPPGNPNELERRLPPEDFNRNLSDLENRIYPAFHQAMDRVRNRRLAEAESRESGSAGNGRDS